ncbi:hypothetical protein U6A24_11580 [Aquimarina gracilis]|uniref:Lipocalin-like domain-containing protein n=1 Tax=Aquimarina gracilis TaxID=874422 RepID=A0ABU5ZW52_9FLAO|nr:hypothetical protein [Aquimarina gracilis]MEB3346106.1 hypothetical protein [Aquimarina gracilis]
MKKLNLFLFSSLLLGAISCGSDDESPADLTQVDPNPVEDMVIDVNTASQGISVNGATRVTGNAPTPNGNISFETSATEQSAFLSNGFDIRLNVPDTYAGAYLQVVENGTAASDYLDIPNLAFGASNATRTKKHGMFKNTPAKMNDNEVTIDVNFAETLPPGQFCYFLCIYDDAGNISEPVEVCVEVEAWGGNNNLVGTWNYTKSVEEGVTTNIGDADCEAYEQFGCNNNETITIEDAYCFTLNSLPIIFNADGTYSFEEKFSVRDIDFNATAETCTPTFKEEDETYSSRGNWAYDEEEKKLTLIEFSYVETSNGETFEGTEENGYVIFSGTITLSGSELVISETFNEDGIELTDQYFFTKQ